MPSATNELRAKWGGVCEHDSRIEKAVYYLEQRGYLLTDSWEWVLPHPGHEPTEEETSAIIYMMQEWDWGGLSSGDSKPKDHVDRGADDEPVIPR